MVLCLEPLSSLYFWSETFHVVSNHEGFASPRASSSLHRRSFSGTAEEGHIDLGRTGRRSGRERNARRTCDLHSLWLDDEHARVRRHSFLVPH